MTLSESSEHEAQPQPSALAEESPNNPELRTITSSMQATTELMDEDQE